MYAFWGMQRSMKGYCWGVYWCCFFLQCLHSPAVISKMCRVLNVMAGSTPVLEIIYKPLYKTNKLYLSGKWRKTRKKKWPKRSLKEKNLNGSGHSFPGFTTDKESYVQDVYPSALVADLRDLGNSLNPSMPPLSSSGTWHWQWISLPD